VHRVRPRPHRCGCDRDTPPLTHLSAAAMLQ
jgi:hypothetical protein